MKIHPLNDKQLQELLTKHKDAPGIVRGILNAHLAAGGKTNGVDSLEQFFRDIGLWK